MFLSKTFLDFISEQNLDIRSECDKPNDSRYLLLHSAKLMEESGELAEAVLLHIGEGQRKEKLDKFKEEDLGREIADVLIVALLIADTVGVDINNVIKEKTDIIKGRRGTRLSVKSRL